MDRNERRRIEKLISEGRSIAARLAKIYAEASGLKFDDLHTFAIEALVLSARKYDATKDVKFTTFAYRRIKGCIVNSFRKSSPVPHRIQNFYWRGLSIRKRFPKLLHEEFLQKLELTNEQWKNCWLAMKYYYFGFHRRTQSLYMDECQKQKRSLAIPELWQLMECFGFDKDMNHRKAGRKYQEVAPEIRTKVIELRQVKGWGYTRIQKHLNIKRWEAEKVLREEGFIK